MEDGKAAFRIDGEQRAVYELLRGLLGERMAALFYDACALASGAVTSAAPAMMVGHYMREIQSAVLEVYENRDALTPDDLRWALSDAEVNDRVSRAWLQKRGVLRSLGIDPGSDLGRRFHGMAFHQVGHRRGVLPRYDVATMKPNPDDFVEVFGPILKRLKDQFDRIIERAEAKVINASPSTGAKVLQQEIPHVPSVMAAIFNRLEGTAWIAALQARGFFEVPPQAIPDGSGGQYEAAWPAMLFLRRMAKESPKEVAAIVKPMELDKNPNGAALALETIAALPPEHSAPLAENVVEYARIGRRFSTKELEEIVQGWAGAGFLTEAALVLDSCLELDEPQTPEERDQMARLDIQVPNSFWLESWELERLVSRVLPHLTKADPCASLRMLGLRIEEGIRIRQAARDSEGTAGYRESSWASGWHGASRSFDDNAYLPLLHRGLREALSEAHAQGKSHADMQAVMNGRKGIYFDRLRMHLIAEALNDGA